MAISLEIDLSINFIFYAKELLGRMAICGFGKGIDPGLSGYVDLHRVRLVCKPPPWTPRQHT